MGYRTDAMALWSMLGLLVLAGASCATRRPEVRPPISIPEAAFESGLNPMPERWWTNFNDPTLDDLVGRALGGNLDLRTVWDRLAQAEAIVRKQGAAPGPRLGIEGSVSRSVERSDLRPAGAGSDRTTAYGTAFSLGLVAGYEFDLWGRLRSERDAARLDAEATMEELQAAAITLSGEVASTWYALVEQYGQLDLLKRQMATNEDVLELVTLRFRRGQTGAADVLQQRQLVETRRGDLTVAESRTTVLEHRLAILVGQPPRTRVAAPQTAFVPLPPLPDAGVPAALVRRRPDLRRAYCGVLAADRRAAAALADRFPSVSLAARAVTAGGSARDLFHDWLGSLVGNLAAPLIDAGLRSAEVDRARAVVSERIHAYGQAVLRSLGEVEDALEQERRQRELLASQDRQLGLAARVIERTRDSYTKGSTDYLRVLDALLVHQALQRSRLQAGRQLIEYRIQLCRALAGGWEMPRPAPATPGPAHGESHRGPDPIPDKVTP